jgi:hypothetical protein
MEWWSTGVMEYWNMEWVQMKMQMRMEIILGIIANSALRAAGGLIYPR